MERMFRGATLTESLATCSPLFPPTGSGPHTSHRPAFEGHDALDSALQRGCLIPLAMDSALRSRTSPEGRPLAVWMGRAFQKISVRLP